MTAPSLYQPDASPTDCVDAAYVDRYLALEAERKALTRKAAAKATLAKPMHKAIAAFVDQQVRTGRPRSCQLEGRYRLSIQQVKNSVSWLAQMTRRHSPRLIDQIKADVGTHDDLSIQVVEPPPAAAAAAKKPPRKKAA